MARRPFYFFPGSIALSLSITPGFAGVAATAGEAGLARSAMHTSPSPASTRLTPTSPPCDVKKKVELF
jgi:hypothetical protein